MSKLIKKPIGKWKVAEVDNEHNECETSKSIYDEALEDLKILIGQANARKLSNEIVANRWGIERIRKVISNAEKQEKLLDKIKTIINRHNDSYLVSMMTTSNRYCEIEKLIKELENE